MKSSTLLRILVALLIVMVTTILYSRPKIETSSNHTARPTLQPNNAPEESQDSALDRLRREFVHDPSFSTRCKAPKIAFDYKSCPPSHFATGHVHQPIRIPISKGETTRDMLIENLDALPGNQEIHRINGVAAHHPIFQIFANMTYQDRFFADRVVEFNGAHTKFSYDCTEGIDFRMYHQVRAAMCAQHEQLVARNAADQIGFFPVVDEEYFEYVMTLATSYDAAKSGRPYTFVELGARYGTWIVRGGASYRLAGGSPNKLALFAVEGSCEWYRKMEEHVGCNHFTSVTDLVLAYAAPKSYNSIELGKPETYTKARATSLLQIIPAYPRIDMMDFDIQGFESLAVEEPGVIDLMEQRVAFVHFGTHSTDIEARLLRALPPSKWMLVYGFAGAHTKKLDRGHRCQTPFGPSKFNDGSFGFANLKFYRLSGRRPPLGKTSRICYWDPVALDILRTQI